MSENDLSKLNPIARLAMENERAAWDLENRSGE